MRNSLFCLVASLAVGLVGCGAAEDDPLGTAIDPMKVCAGPNVLEGVDISHYDGTIDWKAVKASGRAFAIAKATESTGYVDPTFATNYSEMKKNGIVRSAYHFFHADVDPIMQADHFLATLGPLETGDLPPTLDLETTNGQSAATVTANTIAWLDYVAMKTGTLPLLYTSPSFVDGMGNPAGLDQHATLWIANWQVSCPNVPAPFQTWAFWQYDDSGSVPGITTACDLDQFDGTLADLNALTVGMGSSSSASSSTSSTDAASSAASTSASVGATVGSSSSTGPGSSSSGAIVTTGVGGGDDGFTDARGGCTCGTASSDADDMPALRLLALGAIVAAIGHRRRMRS